MSDRFILKQFAGNATNDDVHGTGVFGSCKAGSPTLTTDFKQVQSLSAYENGWADATFTNDKLPPANEMQGLQGLLCKAIKEIYSEGIPEWIDGETYYLNSFVQYNGVVYKNITGTSTSTAPDSDTTNWQNEFARLNANNVFTDSQTIKTSDDTGNISFIDTALATNNTTPTNTTYRQVRFTANDDSVVGLISIASDTGGRSSISILASRTIGGTDYNSAISIGVKSDGTAYTIAPTPASTSKTTEIATTQWVSDLLKGAFATSPYRGWCYLGNKVLLQWGHISVAHGGTTVSLMKPYDSTNFSVIATDDSYGSISQNTANFNISTHTTSGFDAYYSLSGSRAMSWISVGQGTLSDKP